MHLFNFKDNKFISGKHDEKLNAKMIHWLPIDNLVNVEILMPDGYTIKGLAEESVGYLNIGDIIQFTRFCFCRLDNKKDGKNLIFWYTHT